MEKYIIDLFQNMSGLTIALLTAGVMLCIVEVFVPKVGLAGLLGVALTACGLSSYYIDGFKGKQVISLLSIIAFVLAIFIIIELILENKGIIKNPDRYKFRTYQDPVDDLKGLIGKMGKAVTNIDLGGTIEVEGKLYYAISDNALAKGSIVEIIGVKNNSLIVR